MEDCEESGAGKEKERKLWTGFHPGSAIFITRRPEQGLPCLPGRASQPSSSWECTSSGRLGAPTAEGRPLQGRLLREGQRRLKGKKEQTSSLGPSFLTCSHGTALDGNTDVSADSGDPGLAPFSLAAPKRFPENSRTPSLSFQERSPRRILDKG